MSRKPIAAAKTAAWKQSFCTQTVFKQFSVGALSLAMVGCASLSFDDKPEAKATETPAAAAKATAIDKAPADLDSAIAQAQANRKKGDFAGAARTLSQLVIFLPDEPRVLGEYGKTLAAMGRSDDALAFLERAIQLSPGDWSLVSAQGVAFDQKNNYAAAQAAYAHALALKPGEPTVLNNAALSRMQAGDLDSAERLLLQAQPGTAEYPRIAENLTLVQNLKQQRAQGIPAPANVAPAPLTIVQAEPSPQMQFSPLPGPALAAAPAETPVERAELLAPESQTVADVEPEGVAEDVPDEEAKPAAVAFSADSGAPKKSQGTIVMAALPKASQAEAASRSVTAKLAVSRAPAVATEKTSVHAPMAAKQERPGPAAAANKTPIYVQAGAYASETRAGQLAASLDRLGARVSPMTAKDGHAVYRVRIGPFLNADQANAAITQAHALGHPDVKIVSE